MQFFLLLFLPLLLSIIYYISFHINRKPPDTTEMGMNSSRENVSDVVSGEDGGGGGGGVKFFTDLPEELIAETLSMTSPRDVCRMSVVASIFRSAAEWNTVWEKFLPVDYQDIIGQAVLDGDRLNQLRSYTKKKLYLCLCDNPILIEGGKKSFSLEKNSGKKCYMLAARNLWIVWSRNPAYWRWTSLPESRFEEVVELIDVCWLEMGGKINTSMLSPNTTYAVYLVYKTTPEIHGLKFQAVEGSIRICVDEKKTREVYLDPASLRRYRGLIERRGSSILDGVYPEERRDGWLEIELGDYFNKDGGDGELYMTLTEIEGGNWKGGLIIEWIEIRPKGNSNRP